MGGAGEKLKNLQTNKLAICTKTKMFHSCVQGDIFLLCQICFPNMGKFVQLVDSLIIAKIPNLPSVIILTA